MNRPDQFFLHNINAVQPCGRGQSLYDLCEPHTVAHRFQSGPSVMSLAAVAAWWSQTESNRRHPACKAGALPTELWPRSSRNSAKPGELTFGSRRPKQRTTGWFALAPPARLLVGPGRLELPTLRLSGVRSNQAELRAYGRTTA